MVPAILRAVDIRPGLAGRNRFTSLPDSLSLIKRPSLDVEGFCLNLHPVKALFVAPFLLHHLGLFGAAVLIAIISL